MERVAEIDRITRHVELSLTELIYREDQRIAKLQEDSIAESRARPAISSRRKPGTMN